MPVSGPLDSFGAILSGLAKRLGLETRLVELRIQQRWPEIVGEPMGSHTWPAQIRFKKLYLLVENSVWLQQLTFLKPALLAKLREAGVQTVQTIYTNDLDQGPYISQTLRIDETADQLAAQVAGFQGQ